MDKIKFDKWLEETIKEIDDKCPHTRDFSHELGQVELLHMSTKNIN